MKALLSSVLFCAALAAQPASIEGAVVDDSDGQPVAGAHITLLSTDFGSPHAFGAMSGRTGHFSIAALPAGSYLLSAERTGRLPAQKPGAGLLRTIRLKRGQQLTAVVI